MKKLLILITMIAWPTSSAFGDEEAVETARAQLMDGEFHGIMDTLGDVDSDDARLLRAIARAGIAVEDDLADFLSRLGATPAPKINVSEDRYDIRFEEDGFVKFDGESEAWPQFRPGTNLDHIAGYNGFLAEALGAVVIEELLSELTGIEDEEFSFVFRASEMNTAVDVEVAHTDVRLVIGALKVMRSVTLISKNVDFNLNLTGDNLRSYDGSLGKLFDENPDLLNPSERSLTSPRDHRRARELVVDAIDDYLEVEEELWTRESDTGREFLFEIGEEEGQEEQEREEFNEWLLAFQRSLGEPVLTSDLFDEEVEGLADRESVRLFPVFEPLELRQLAMIESDLSEEEQEKAVESWLIEAGFLADFFGSFATYSDERESPWFGRYNTRDFSQTEGKGWLRHEEHGWLYVPGRGVTGGTWLWDNIQSRWIWTRHDIHPFFFRDVSGHSGNWLYYEVGGEPQKRWFFFYDEDAGGEDDVARGNWDSVESN